MFLTLSFYLRQRLDSCVFQVKLSGEVSLTFCDPEDALRLMDERLKDPLVPLLPLLSMVAKFSCPPPSSSRLLSPPHLLHLPLVLSQCCVQASLGGTCRDPVLSVSLCNQD